MPRPTTLFFILLATTSCNTLAYYDATISLTAFSRNGAESLSANRTNSLSKEVLASFFDEQDKKILAKTSPSTLQKIEEASRLSVQDIICLHEAGINDDTVTNYITNTRTSYNLNQEQIRQLQHAGISQQLINFIIDTRR